MIKVLFVCMGNICRSPTADGIMRHKLLATDLASQVRVDSAGTHAYHVGNPADQRAQQTALSRGINMKGLRARKMSASDYYEFDYILAMDTDNLDIIQGKAPKDTKAKISLFLQFANEQGLAQRQIVPDPYYGGPEGFIDVFDLVGRGCDALIHHLQSA